MNRGLNCIKGYFLSKIMYGKDRLTQPLLRMSNGEYDKEGDFTPVSWEKAFDVMEEKFKAALKHDLEANKGKKPEEIVSTVGMFGSGQWTVWEGYAASKLYKAGFQIQQYRSQRPPLHGFRGGCVHPWIWIRRTDGLLRRSRACRCIRAVGFQHGRDAPHPVVAADRYPADQTRL